MDNWIFIALMIGSFVIRFLMKKSKETKETEVKRQPTQAQPSGFELVLKQFSDKIGQELRTGQEEKVVKKRFVKPEEVAYETPVVEDNGKERIYTHHNRSKNYKIKKKKVHHLIDALKSPQRMRDVIVTAEILKTKF